MLLVAVDRFYVLGLHWLCVVPQKAGGQMSETLDVFGDFFLTFCAGFPYASGSKGAYCILDFLFCLRWAPECFDTAYIAGSETREPIDCDFMFA